MIKNVPIHEIKPYDNNPRHHPVKQLEAITKSINRFGFRGSILLDKNNVIVAGHARYEAAAVAGLSEIPCEYADDLSEEDIAAYRVLDNKIAEMSSDDIGKLHEEIGKIPDFDFADFGVEIPDIEVLPNEGYCDDDDVPEAKDEPVAKRGDVWLLDRHRVMCGDSTMIDDVEKLMDGEKADMVFTDPPYGINEKGDRRKRNGKNSLRDGVQYDDFNDDTTQYAIDAFNLCAGLNINIQIWFGANYYCHSIPQSNNWLVWDKRIEDNQRDFNSDCELAWVKSSKNSIRIFRHLWKGLIKGSENGQARVHPTQKPIALAEWCFNEYAEDGKSVLDLFGGSGSTLIACEKTGRKCYMMELSPQYVSVIIERWQRFTGKDAILESTGKTFKDMNHGRKTEEVDH